MLSQGTTIFIGQNSCLGITLATRLEKHMKIDTLTTIIGTVAATCTTLSFVPQLIKIHRQGGRDLSTGMLMLYLLGVSLWLAYGIRIDATEVIGANIIAGGLVFTALFMKLRSET